MAANGNVDGVGFWAQVVVAVAGAITAVAVFLRKLFDMHAVKRLEDSFARLQESTQAALDAATRRHEECERKHEASRMQNDALRHALDDARQRLDVAEARIETLIAKRRGDDAGNRRKKEYRNGRRHRKGKIQGGEPARSSPERQQAKATGARR